MEMVKIDIQKGNKRESYYFNPHQIVAIWTEVIDNETPWAGLWMRVVGMPEQLMVESWTSTGEASVRLSAEQGLEQLRKRIQSAASR